MTTPAATAPLLDLKNDFVVKKLFADAPELLAALMQDESTMQTIGYSPVALPLDRLKALNADAQTRHQALVRERDIVEEAMPLSFAREEGKVKTLVATLSRPLAKRYAPPKPVHHPTPANRHNQPARFLGRPHRGRAHARRCLVRALKAIEIAKSRCRRQYCLFAWPNGFGPGNSVTYHGP